MTYHKDKHPSDATVIARLNKAYAAGKLGQVSKPYWRDGWFGRGFPQLTHEFNYKRAQAETGLPFHDEPDTALDPEASAKVLVLGMIEGWFTGKKISDYCTLKKSDFYNARKVINGLDRASEYAKYCKAYDEALKEEGYGVSDVKPIPQPQAKPTVHKSLAESKEMLMGATGLLGAVTAFLEQIDGKTVAIALACLAAVFIANRLYARWKGER